MRVDWEDGAMQLRSETAGPGGIPRQRTSPPERRTIAQAFEPRCNNVNALRLLLATAVLVSHSWLFVYGEPDPFGRLGGPNLGELSVDGFFLLSGFLIARSNVHASSMVRYFWHRLLRIMPAFWVCLAVTAVVLAPLLWWLERDGVAGYPWAGDDSALTYTLGNAALRMTQFNIGDLADGEALDGSLHTLYFEALCYVMIGVLGAFGVMRRRPVVVLLLVGACWAVAVYNAISPADVLANSLTMHFVSVFSVGSAMFLYADRIPLARGLFAASLIALPTGMAVPGAYPVLGVPALGYLLLYAGVDRRLARIGSVRDLSYGIYIYAWPVQLLLLEAGVGNLAAHAVVALLASALLASASWRLIERPALSLKSRSFAGRPRKRPPPVAPANPAETGPARL